MDTPIPIAELPRNHPVQAVADHEVLFAFNADRQAILFREWWGIAGEAAFTKWFARQKRE